MAAIGVFDSGMGGLSVLSDLLEAFPHERFIYLGDNLNAPYGPRTEEDIRALTLKGAKSLMREEVKALVIACNTATAVAEESLRCVLPVPVVGIEPELLSARACAAGKRVLVLATAATFRQKRFRDARTRNCPDAIPIPCPELVLMVENGITSGPGPENYFRRIFAPYPREEIGAVVLGCTHFPFLKRPLHNVLPGVPLLDGNQALIARLRATLRGREALSSAAGGFELHTTAADPAVLRRMRRLLAEGQDES